MGPELVLTCITQFKENLIGSGLELLVNVSPSALRYVVCVLGVIAGGCCLCSSLGWGNQLLAAFGQTAASFGCTGIGFGQVCFLVLTVVNGRGLAALQLEISVFAMDIMALWNFCMKLPVSETWAQFDLPSLLLLCSLSQPQVLFSARRCSCAFFLI